MSILSSIQIEQLKAAIQDGLPLVPNPYAAIAQQIGLREEDVLNQVSSWLHEGYIKRMGLVVRHHSLGYRANAMVVMDIPDKIVDLIAERIHKQDCITLCYRRRRQPPEWPYNLFCMIHGKNRAQVLHQLDHLILEHKLQQYPRSILFSNQQFKQTGGQYARHAG